MTLQADTIRVVPTGAALGADVVGIDARRPLTAEAAALVRRAWLDHLVIRLRGQRLDDAALMAFTRQFGDLEYSPSTEITDKFGAFDSVPPEITVISNIKEQGRPIGTLGAGEAFWHTDSSFIETPPAGSFLYAIELPPEGGNTQFCNMYRAYEELPADLRAAIRGRRAVHSFAYTSAGQLRVGYEDVTDVTRSPGARHPLVRCHPETGRPALYLGRRLGSYVLGMPVEESEALLDALWAHATRPDYVWTQVWQPGDIVIWDNRCTLHRRDAFDAGTRRLLHRTQTKGDVPYEVPATH